MFYYTIKNQKIHSSKLEFNLTEHCNYCCNECSHFAPYMQPKYASYNVFKKDINALGKVFQVYRFRFCGGEPLLHPDLLRFVRHVRKSKIASKIEIVSNGSLFHKIDDAVLRDIDIFTISWYPDSRFNQYKYSIAKKKCRKFNTTLKVNKRNQFRISYLDYPNEDDVLVEQIYGSCQIVNNWYAQTFYNGSFYICSRPLFLNSYLKFKGKREQDFRVIDGVPLHESKLFNRLVAYIQRDKPLKSCRYCLGSIGITVPWRQMSNVERKKARPLNRNPIEKVNLQQMHCLNKWSRIKNNALKFAPSLEISHIIDLMIEAHMRKRFSLLYKNGFGMDQFK